MTSIGLVTCLQQIRLSSNRVEVFLQLLETLTDFKRRFLGVLMLQFKQKMSRYIESMVVPNMHI